MPKPDRVEGNQLANELLDAFTRFDRAMHTGGRKHIGMATKPGQLFVLINLRKRGPGDGSGLRVSELAGNLGVTPSSITQIVTELEARGLVTRNMDAADRRAVRVSLTEAGDAIMEDFQRPYLPVMDELARFLGTERSRTLIGLLAEVDGFFSRRRGGGDDDCPAMPAPWANRPQTKEHMDQ